MKKINPLQGLSHKSTVQFFHTFVDIGTSTVNTIGKPITDIFPNGRASVLVNDPNSITELDAWANDVMHAHVLVTVVIDKAEHEPITPKTPILFRASDGRITIESNYHASDFGFKADSDADNFCPKWCDFATYLNEQAQDWRAEKVKASWKLFPY